MAIMDCYPDRRAIENELGGKWEKVETINVDGSDIFTYDEDIDGTPLNLNGIMLVGNIAVSATATTSVYSGVNDNTLLFTSSNAITTGSPYFFIKAVNSNGLYDYRQSASGSNVRGRMQTYSSSTIETTPFVNNYFRLALSVPSTATMTGTIDVYFLRGV